MQSCPPLRACQTLSLQQISAALSLLAFLFLLCGARLNAQEQTPPRLLTTAAEIRALSPEQAAQQHPIRLRGCFMAREVNSFSLQDETDSIFVFTTAGIPLLDYQRGDLIEVEGVTNPGDYAPCATANRMRKLGTVSIPEPQATNIAKLYSGQMDAQWVEITGIVRHVEIVPSEIPKSAEMLANSGVSLSTKLKLEDDGSMLLVEMQEVLDPSSVIDARVSLRGHCFYLHNGNRQFVRPILHVPIGVKPDILTPPRVSDFNRSPRPISSLFTFDHNEGNSGHRVHVRGIVLHHRPGMALWIRDETQSLQVESAQLDELLPGNIVDVLGYPGPGTYSPILQDAVFKKRSDSDQPSAKELQDLRMISLHNSDLVRLQAKLLEVQRYPESVELTLDALGTTVRASLLTGKSPTPIPDWSPGSIVEVSGIATVGEGETVPMNGLWWSQSLHILLRYPQDLVVIEPSPWWNAMRISYLLAGILVVAIATIAFVLTHSRRRLREQKQQRTMAEYEFSAILNERNRVAREIHDTLAQNIGAISMQLELIKTDSRSLSDSTQRHLQTAHTLARTALADARDSIWNMRSQVLEKYDLIDALVRIAAQLTHDTDINARVEVVGPRKRLSPVVENNLLRIGQETMTNACKHAKPRNITVQISFLKRRVELLVVDDGIGFEADQAMSEPNRHFGLVGIRERVELLGGDVRIQSSKGNGTSIRVSVSD